MELGNWKGAQAYFWHTYLNTLKFYDDNRKQLQKRASAKLAETISWRINSDSLSDH
ncbi:hypothetical protein AM1_0195 [Acaryochloris marina MBIC11017]|uniref:Uncharacterized protein n=1 Tax=Acaryochloris marina (strain MBIC 11017) TaxID=329726 RepID=B0C7M1_ACAM1|nr:hypothetical protein AM1_0195 [Acaryochloris marina MBIC11017]